MGLIWYKLQTNAIKIKIFQPQLTLKPLDLPNYQTLKQKAFSLVLEAPWDKKQIFHSSKVYNNTQNSWLLSVPYDFLVVFKLTAVVCKVSYMQNYEKFNNVNYWKSSIISYSLIHCKVFLSFSILYRQFGVFDIVNDDTKLHISYLVLINIDA